MWLKEVTCIPLWEKLGKISWEANWKNEWEEWVGVGPENKEGELSRELKKYSTFREHQMS